METRLVITLNHDERAGLEELAMSELRDPRAQLLCILRQELQRRGLWPAGERPAQVRGQGGDDARQCA